MLCLKYKSISHSFTGLWAKSYRTKSWSHEERNGERAEWGLQLMKITEGPSQSSSAVQSRNIGRPKKKDPQYLKVHVDPKVILGLTIQFQLKQTRFDSIEQEKEPGNDTCG